MKITTFLCFWSIFFLYAGNSYPRQTLSALEMNKAAEKVIINETKVAADPIKITGLITDERGEPLPGVTISLKSDKKVANFSGADGKYLFTVTKPGETLIFSFIGMKEEEVRLKDGVTNYNVKLYPADNQLKEVVVETGMFQRDRVSFTGSVSTYTGQELRNISNQNVLKSLKVLDPSFVILDNSLRGSDPNSMPTIEMRGQGGSVLNATIDEFGNDPNQPLFVLNGVEVSISRINDLDINRVESITILRDAGSTAIYGSKGANGVIVVETIKPKPGELKVYYSGDFQIDMTDLSGYNMMNASEKLEFERLAGKYTNTSSAASQKALMELYNYRLADIQRGVDTYWLSQPVQTGFTHGHSVRVSGGNEFLTIDGGAKYKNNQGVMKGSGRETWAGNISMVYRNQKFIVSNDLDITGYKATNSPYGDFSTWVNTSPYFRMRNEDGTVEKYLQYRTGLGYADLSSPIVDNIPNPLYNALLNSKDERSDITISNSFQIQYMPTDELRFKAGLDLIRTNSKTTQFSPPENTKYNDLTMYEKGEYFHKDLNQMVYKGRIDGAYAKVIDKHSITINARAQMEMSKTNYVSVTAVGFPYGSQGTPNLAYSYKQESKPGYLEDEKRSVGLVGALTYDFDKRYLFNFSLSVDGTSSFGSNKLYKSFWSAGIGWNINQESFMKDQYWIDILKIRATIGTSGSQNSGTTYSKSVYTYFIDSNIFGQGAYLSNVGNPDLPWAISKDFDAGIDFRILNGRTSLTFDYFRKKNDPNIIPVPLVPSTGISSYPMDLGYQINEGVEFRATVFPIYNLKDRILWSLSFSGIHNKKTYRGFGNAIDSYNLKQQQSNTMRQYVDGYSDDDIWAVRSYGIDPATGQEIYIKKDGSLTFDYDADDMVAVGSTRPDLRGVISTSFRYKNFEIGMAFSYSFGSDIYNNVLYNKVENITKSQLEKNQDKRALYDRWKNPGDIAEYKGISIVSSTSPRTSRFIQKNNYLRAESISCKYDIINNEWVKQNLGISTLSVTGYLNDIFRLETSKTERSTQYPFARSVALGVNLSF
ncbi:TonB-linked SusC/RagA family outer membrane protein [Dysgonomonas hofstadii]|uniref:TonB-linked SusC/RagA family outer membrane protein n=1 Tax=Dysgonomonas hofstadii TaxID=637886 RepID=A0A840CI15_9BACT|nr:SusC/RagA family TonB-linked outer membrane protein [Dysgonomonas hofstadii]MBB4035657.1 TonB-linked SusC/RagA family outer membrane protein [Dysgonomonas hofstadii]